MITIGLCDDDTLTLDFCCKEIESLSKEINTPLITKRFISGESLLFNLEENPNQFDIIVIDVLMENINGIDTTKILRKYGYKGFVIFLTSSSEFALDAFEVEASNYVLKNSETQFKFKDVLSKSILEVKNKVTKKLILSTKKHRIVIDLKNILYIESINKKLVFYSLFSPSEEIYSTLNYVYAQIEKFGFIRCHKSYIVNARYIISFNKLQCILKNNIRIPIGRKYSSDFENEFIKFEFENILI